MVLLRRFLVVSALLFWQGGFLFYTSVVVPIGQRALGDVGQGFITRSVTHYLHLAGAVALLPFAWDVVCTADVKPRRRARLVCLTVLLVAVVLLTWLHANLESLLDIETQTVLYHRRFRSWHRAYLWASTLQWAVALVFTVLTLAAWRHEDRVPSSAR